jgi:hypothetical protein
MNPTGQTSSEHEYPHQRGEGIVTPDDLRIDLEANPGAYHPHLHAPIRQHLARSAQVAQELETISGDPSGSKPEADQSNEYEFTASDAIEKMKTAEGLDFVMNNRDRFPALDEVYILHRSEELNELDRYVEYYDACLPDIDPQIPIQALYRANLPNLVYLSALADHVKDNRLLIELAKANQLHVLDDFPHSGEFNQDVADVLLEKNYYSSLLAVLDEFPADVVQNIYTELDARKEYGVIARGLKYFPQADQDSIARYIFNPNNEETTRIWESGFTHLDGQILKLLTDTADLRWALEHYNIFDNPDSETFIRTLINAGMADDIIQFGRQFSQSDFFTPELYQQMIDTLSPMYFRYGSHLSFFDGVSGLDFSKPIEEMIKESGDIGSVKSIFTIKPTPIIPGNIVKMALSQSREYDIERARQDFYRPVNWDLWDHEGEWGEEMEDMFYPELPAETEKPEREFDESTAELHITKQNAEFVVDRLYAFSDMSPEILDDLRQLTDRPWLSEYPRDAKSGRIKDEWFGRMSYAQLEGGFSYDSIGHIIRQRIEQGVDATIHDASQWLSEFRMPSTGYDSAAIVRARKASTFDPEAIHVEKLHDQQTEKAFFVSLFSASDELRARLRLSAKPGAALDYFYDPLLRLMYDESIRLNEAGIPVYQTLGFNVYSIYTQVQDRLKDDNTDGLTIGHQKMSPYVHADTKMAQFSKLVLELQDEKSNETPITEHISALKIMGQRRKVYVDDTQDWLARHATSPAARLTKVWGDRPRALLEGVADNARSINAWQSEAAFKDHVELREHNGVLGALKAEYYLGEATRPMRQELIRKMSAFETVVAMEHFHDWQQSREWENKQLPGARMPIHVEEVKAEKPFIFEVFDKDDPRGMTIGIDTGCCMTLGGESTSCIEAGYSKQNAGFVALYAPDGKIMAQSFWYINPEAPTTLVLDNIEANEGRDYTKITSLYTRALEQYIADHPETGITTVHVGEGYTDVTISHLPPAKPVKVPWPNVYTDAKRQRVLISQEK